MSPFSVVTKPARDLDSPRPFGFDESFELGSTVSRLLSPRSSSLITRIVSCKLTRFGRCEIIAKAVSFNRTVYGYLRGPESSGTSIANMKNVA